MPGGGQGQRISIKDRRYTNHDANCAEAWPVFRCPDMLGHVADSLRVRVSVDMCDEDPCKRFGVYWDAFVQYQFHTYHRRPVLTYCISVWWSHQWLEVGSAKDQNSVQLTHKNPLEFSTDIGDFVPSPHRQTAAMSWRAFSKIKIQQAAPPITTGRGFAPADSWELS